MLRQHQPNLRPLKTRSELWTDPRCKSSSLGAGTSSGSLVPFPSPTIVVTRAYYLEQGTPIGPDLDTFERRKSLIEGHLFPRRHPVVSSTARNLASQLESFKFGSATHELHVLGEADENDQKIKTKNEEKVVIVESQQVRVGPEAVSEKNLERLYETPPELLRQVPFEYTHDHLRDWGQVYLGKSATADAFVNAVSMRRPSLTPAQDDEYPVKSSCLVTIRARVVPKARERKPFLIQRQFDIDELRASIPKIRTSEQHTGLGSRSVSPKNPRRSSRVRRSSAQHITNSRQRRGSLDTHRAEKDPSFRKGAVALHIEYALHFLPILAAILLSGHVRKGDSIDLPMPYPESWPDVVAYIYTGRGILTTGMRENILYLAGHA